MQPEISFIKKLIRMRKSMQRRGVERIDRSEEVHFLERHIDYNGYHKPIQAKKFFLKNAEKIHRLIGVKGGKLEREFNELYKGSQLV